MRASNVTLLVDRPNVGLKTLTFHVFHEPDEDPVEVVRKEFDFSGVLIKSTRVTQDSNDIRSWQTGGELLALRKR